jgi:hypothetical protein
MTDLGISIIDLTLNWRPETDLVVLPIDDEGRRPIGCGHLFFGSAKVAGPEHRDTKDPHRDSALPGGVGQ